MLNTNHCYFADGSDSMDTCAGRNNFVAAERSAVDQNPLDCDISYIDFDEMQYLYCTIGRHCFENEMSGVAGGWHFERCSFASHKCCMLSS